MKKNFLKTLGACALVGMTSLSLASCSFSDVKDKIKDFFDGNNGVEDTITDGVITDEGVVDEGSTVAMPSSLIFGKKNAQASSPTQSLTVSCTVLPSYAVNQKLNWTLSWSSQNSASVSDYVTITPSADTHSCTVVVKKAFTTQILLKVKTTDGSDLSKTCTIDYLGRELVGGTSDIDCLDADLTNSTFGGLASDLFKDKFTIGGGSINGTLEVSGIRVYVGDDFEFSDDDCCYDTSFTDTTTFLDYAKSHYNTHGYLSGSTYNEFLRNLDEDNAIHFSIAFNFKYNGNTYYNTFNNDYQVYNFSFSSQYKVTSLNVNDSTLIY